MVIRASARPRAALVACAWSLGLLLVGCGEGSSGADAADAAREADAALADGGRLDSALAADADAPGTDGAPAGPPQPASDFPLSLGLGERSYSAVDHGAVALLQRGCQGAQHVWISLRSPALAPGTYLMTLSATRAADGGEAVPAHDLEFDWVAADDGGAELLGVTLVVFDALAVVDAEVDVLAEVQAGDGRVGRAVRRLRVEWGPDDC